MALAEALEVEIISVDSAQVYRGMDRGTAKPDAEERARVPHHLIDLLQPEENYSAGAFCRDASALIEQVRARGRVPLLVGGTMLYFNALLNGISVMPEAVPELRDEIDREAEAVGWPQMHARLAELDPVAASKIQPQDKQRIQRALELNRLTGKSVDALHAASEYIAPKVAAFALRPADRADLHQRIGQRLDQMFDRGLVEEVRSLRERPGLNADTPSMRAVGYRQVWSHLDGEWDLATARDRAAAATRNLAKRQITWMSKLMLAALGA
jgi:tRNA dimethylallyltransferase